MGQMSKRLIGATVLVGALIFAFLGRKFLTPHSLSPFVQRYQVVANFRANTNDGNDQELMKPILPGRTQTQLSISGVAEVIGNPEGEKMAVFMRFDQPAIKVEADMSAAALQISLQKILENGIHFRFLGNGQLETMFVSDDMPMALREVMWDLGEGLNQPKPLEKSTDITLLAPGKKIRERFSWTNSDRLVLSKETLSIDDILQKVGYERQGGSWHILSSEGKCEFEDANSFFARSCQSILEVELKQNGKVILNGSKQVQFLPLTGEPSRVNLSQKSSKPVPARPPELDLSVDSQKMQLRKNLALNNTKDMVLRDELSRFRDHLDPDSEWEVGPRMGWTEKMADYLLLHPEALPEFMAFVDEVGPKGKLFSLLPHTLSVAGTPEAQQSLISMALKYESDPQAMFQIVSSMLFVDNPEVSTVEYLEKLHSKAIEQTSDVAMMALGKYGRSADESGDRAFQYVKLQLETAKDDNSRSVAISALGNGGRSENLEILKNYLKSENPDLRSRAVDALRFVTSEDRYVLIMQAMTADRDPTVRTAAAASLQYQPINSIYVSQLIDAVGKEKEMKVRAEQYKVLVKYSHLVPNRVEVFAELRSNEPNGDLQNYLAGEMSRLE